MTQTVHKQKRWPYVIFIIIGLLMMFIPKFSAFASMAFEVILGWILTLGAIFQILLLIFYKRKKDIVMWILSIVLLSIGLYFLFNPASAAKLMTWLFAAITLISGISSVLYSFSFRRNVKMVFLLNGIIGIAFACMIWASWPLSSISFIGILLGINLVMTGLTHLIYKK